MDCSKFELCTSEAAQLAWFRLIDAEKKQRPGSLMDQVSYLSCAGKRPSLQFSTFVQSSFAIGLGRVLLFLLLDKAPEIHHS